MIVCPFQNVYRCVVTRILLSQCVIMCARVAECVRACICVYIFVLASEVCICAIRCVWPVAGAGICVCDCSTICLSWFSMDAVQGAQLL